MKTLADFKRALVLGSKWSAYNEQCGELGIREVEKVQKESVAFKNEQGKISWLQFPKASEFGVNSNGEAQIYWPATYTYEGVERVEIPRKLILTYTKI